MFEKNFFQIIMVFLYWCQWWCWCWWSTLYCDDVKLKKMMVWLVKLRIC